MYGPTDGGRVVGKVMGISLMDIHLLDVCTGAGADAFVFIAKSITQIAMA